MAIPRRDMEPEGQVQDHQHANDSDIPATSDRGIDRTPDRTVDATTSRSVVAAPFGLAQIFMLSIGIFLTVLGTIGLARAGIDTWTTPRIEIGAFTMTPLMAVILLGAGILCLASAATRGSARAMSMLLGPVMVAGGLILLLQPFADLGANRAMAILLMACGVGAIIGAMATPTIAFSSETRRTETI